MLNLISAAKEMVRSLGCHRTQLMDGFLQVPPSFHQSLQILAVCDELLYNVKISHQEGLFACINDSGLVLFCAVFIEADQVSNGI